MNQVSSHLYVPSQVPVPALHLGLDPEQGSLVPHLHTPDTQVFVVSEHPESSAHSAIEIEVKIELYAKCAEIFWKHNNIDI